MPLGMGAFHSRAGQERSAGLPVVPPRDWAAEIAALQLMAALVEFSEDPVIGLALDGSITYWNPAAERLYGYAPHEALGSSIAMLGAAGASRPIAGSAGDSARG
jgi:PAS domain-containing protein